MKLTSNESFTTGRVITGYLFNDTYHQIGKGNPQWPQVSNYRFDSFIPPINFFLNVLSSSSSSLSTDIGSHVPPSIPIPSFFYYFQVLTSPPAILPDYPKYSLVVDGLSLFP